MKIDWNFILRLVGGVGLEGFVKMFYMFYGMILDLKWDVKEMLVFGNKVIVCSEVFGMFNFLEGFFFGVLIKGEKFFFI